MVGEASPNNGNAREKEEGRRLNPTTHSKWCRLKSKGELEFDLSLVRVKASVRRFIANCIRPADQRLKGKYTLLELQDAEEAIIPKAQTEMDALKREKHMQRSTLALLSPVFVFPTKKDN